MTTSSDATLPEATNVRNSLGGTDKLVRPGLVVAPATALNAYRREPDDWLSVLRE